MFLVIADANNAVIQAEPIDAVKQEITTIEQTVDANGDPNNMAGGKQSPFNHQMIFLILMIVIIYFFLFRGPRQKQKKHQQMVQQMQKNDRVRTIGGILGTVIEVRDNEVVIKVDEATNTKMKVVKGAIAEILKEEKTN